ncbi:succinate dehydrogenase [ubiquinone] cytochrome b small subunit, mitochondrial [Athalia rosae]|uniref:succinate dehydrogenase [ubiquinone] cytochrome b small subunit, mitochondrial n=1 Tax=Athalia rosae TaxID=37344 RepID=UPI002033FCFE|nr:succinate dehydrogenase [ubiquinone] cytochrome b small subunit, mitochondrial [Athalia rosae]
MARCHLSRQLSLLTGKLGNHVHHPLVRSAVAVQGINPHFSSLLAQKHTIAPSFSSKLIVKPLLQPNLLRSITTSPLLRTPVTGDHVRLWQVERVTSAVLIGLLPACVILQNPVVDSTLALLMVMHSHWGLEAIVIDYARPIVVGNIFPKVAHLALYLLSATTLAGLLFLIYNGPGLGKTVRNFWAVGTKEASK